MQRKISLFQSDPEDSNSEVNRSVEHIDYADIFNFFQPLFSSHKNVETRNINSGTTTIEGAILKELTFINTKKQKAYALSYMAGIKDTLTVFDYTIFCVLSSMLQNEPKNVIYTKKSFLIKSAGLNSSGKSYQMIEHSLMKLSSVFIYAENAMYDYETNTYYTKFFGNIFTFIYDRKTSMYKITFNEEYTKAMNKKSTFSIDVEMVKRFNKNLSPFLYRIVQQAKKTNINELSIKDLPIALNMEISKPFPSVIFSRLKPALDELVSFNILTSYKRLGDILEIYYENSERIIKEINGVYYLIQQKNELYVRLVENGGMSKQYFESIYKKFGNEELSILYEKARIISSTSDAKSRIIYDEVGISKLIMSVYLEHTELFIPEGKKIELEFNSLGRLHKKI